MRFSLPISALPYFDGAAPVLKIALSWRGVAYQNTVTVPSYSAAAGQSTNVYFIQQVTSALNTALATSYASIIVANPTDYQVH